MKLTVEIFTGSGSSGVGVVCSTGAAGVVALTGSGHVFAEHEPGLQVRSMLSRTKLSKMFNLVVSICSSCWRVELKDFSAVETSKFVTAEAE